MWETLRRDRCWRWFLPCFLALHLPYFIHLLTPFDLQTLAEVYVGTLQLPLVILLFLCGLGRVQRREERLFWLCLALAFALWWLNSLLFTFLPDSWWGLGVELATDALFGGYYVAWLFAITIAPHDHRSPKAVGAERLPRFLGVLLLIVGFWVYAVGVPSRLNPELYHSWVPSLYLYVAFDVVLLGLFARLAVVSRGRRWPFIYGMLALTSLISAVLDLVEALTYRGILEWPPFSPLDLLWSLPFLTLAVAIRARHHDFEDSDEFAAGSHKDGPWRSLRPTPMMLSALAFPLVHIGGYRLGLLDQPSELVRERVVLVCLAALAVLASVENAWLRRLARRVVDTRHEMRELRVAREVAERSDLSKSRFVANVSHEIRTPMHGILDMARILREGPLPRQERIHAELLESSGTELLKVIDELLDYSTIEAGALTLRDRPFTLRDPLRELMQNLVPALDNTDVRLELRIEGQVPDSYRGDGQRLQQVLRVLLGNAVKFTESGHIALSVSLGTCPDVGAVTVESGVVPVRFSVRDTGIGVPQEARERLFQPFTQGDSSSARRYGGTGLGLAICARLVEAMGGQLELESPSDGGALFRFELPLTRGDADAGGRTGPLLQIWSADHPVEPLPNVGADSGDGPEPRADHGWREVAGAVEAVQDRAEAQRPEVARGQEDTLEQERVGLHEGVETSDGESRGTRSRILLAEDNPVSQLIATHLLESLGCDVEVVRDGHEVLALLEAGGFDLVLMDCQMPGLDGLQATRLWRRNERNDDHLPIIAVTAHQYEQEREQCLQAGMDEVLSKPFDQQQLRRMLSRWLGEAQLPLG